MFGLSFGELVVLVIVAIVVIGPKDMPRVLRKVGRWAGQLRRMASDLRVQSGIDEALRAEGLSDDIAEIRRLARGELDSVAHATRYDLPRPIESIVDEHDVDRTQEYPSGGADGYGALPDNALLYAQSLPPSVHAENALYTRGEIDITSAAALGSNPPESKSDPIETTREDDANAHSAARDVITS